MPVMWPRRVERSAVMSPNFSIGTLISIWTIGSSRTGRAAWNALRKACGRGRLERLLRAIDRVVAAEEDLDLDVDDRVARDDPLLQLLADPLLDRRDELVGDHAPLDRVDEVEPLAARPGAGCGAGRRRTGRGRRSASCGGGGPRPSPVIVSR